MSPRHKLDTTLQTFISDNVPSKKMDVLIEAPVVVAKGSPRRATPSTSIGPARLPAVRLKKPDMASLRTALKDSGFKVAENTELELTFIALRVTARQLATIISLPEVGSVRVNGTKTAST